MENSENRVLFCTNMGQKWDVLRSVSSYSSAFDMISMESEWLEMDCFSNAFCEWLKSVDQFESYSYTVLNGEIYVLSDSITGDVLQTGEISNFIWESFRQFQAEEGELE